MPKRSRKPKEDVNQIAFRVVHDSTAEPPKTIQVRVKNAAAVELGRLGGIKGGPARAHSLTKEQRIKIAEMAAKARWDKEKRKK